jgi:hypothetical protein
LFLAARRQNLIIPRNAIVVGANGTRLEVRVIGYLSAPEDEPAEAEVLHRP